MHKNTINVTAVGLNIIEQETLRAVFRLSGRYQYVPVEQAASADVALVNLDDPDTLLYWKSSIDRPDLATVVVAEHSGLYGELTYLERRYTRRQCFAKQVLSAVATAVQSVPKLDKPAPVAVQPTWHERLAERGAELIEKYTPNWPFASPPVENIYYR